MRRNSFILVFFIVSLVTFSFQMSPISFEKRIDNGQGFKEFYFPNTGNKTIRYKFTPLPGSVHRGDMSKWVELYPKILTIKPEETGVLKVFIQAPKEAPEGEYGFLLDSLPIEVLDKDEQSKDIKAASTVKIRTAIELVGYIGDIRPILKLEKYKIFSKDKNIDIDFIFKNNSDKRGVELTALIKGKNNKVIRRDLGRVGKSKELETIIELKGVSERDFYELEIVETSTNISLLKTKI